MAVDRYDPDFGNPFASTRWPAWSARSNAPCATRAWRVHVSRPVKERSLRLQGPRRACRTPRALTHHPRVRPSHLGISEVETLSALEVVHSRSEVFTDQQVGDEGDTSPGGPVSPPPREEHCRTCLLPELTDGPPEPEREIVVLASSTSSTSQIAARVGCSQMHVSRPLRRALGRLRTQLLVG